jgi:hypothetical protein
VPLHPALRVLLGEGDAYFPQPLRKLPRPPNYTATGGSLAAHCSQWNAWLEANRASRAIPPTVALTAPSNTAVTIVSAVPHIVRAFVPSAATYVECDRGAGGFGGTSLAFDLAHPARRPVVVTDTGRRFAMPDGVITVDAGRTEYIAFDGAGPRYRPGRQARLYEWYGELTIVVAQHQEIDRVGSASEPLVSWSGPPARTFYDFDFQLRRSRRLGRHDSFEG